MSLKSAQIFTSQTSKNDAKQPNLNLLGKL